MIQPTLLFGALLSALCAAIYFYVGRVLSRRHASTADSRLAWRLFVVWWYALASSNVISAVLSMLGAFQIIGLPLFTTFTLLNMLAICVALYGLVFYLLYLFTGSRKVLGPLSIFYIVYYTLLVYYVQASIPMDVTIRRWTAALAYQSPLTGPFFYACAADAFAASHPGRAGIFPALFPRGVDDPKISCPACLVEYCHLVPERLHRQFRRLLRFRPLAGSQPFHRIGRGVCHPVRLPASLLGQAALWCQFSDAGKSLNACRRRSREETLIPRRVQRM